MLSSLRDNKGTYKVKEEKPFSTSLSFPFSKQYPMMTWYDIIWSRALTDSSKLQLEKLHSDFLSLQAKDACSSLRCKTDLVAKEERHCSTINTRRQC